MSKKIHCHTMGSPQNMERGLRGCLEWQVRAPTCLDSFLLASSVPEASKIGSYLHSRKISVPQMEVEVEKITFEGNMLEAMPS
jgi:hypothetical protein